MVGAGCKSNSRRATEKDRAFWRAATKKPKEDTKGHKKHKTQKKEIVCAFWRLFLRVF